MDARHGSRWSLRCGVAHHFAHQTAWHDVFAVDVVDAVNVVTWRDVTVWTGSTVGAGLIMPQSRSPRGASTRRFQRTERSSTP